MVLLHIFEITNIFLFIQTIPFIKFNLIDFDLIGLLTYV